MSEPVAAKNPDRLDAQPAPILDTLRGPEDLRRLERRDLTRVCSEMRQLIIDTVLQTGGHLGSNLGVVEITVALHYVFDLLRDRIVWDVSHQVYPHKVLTGRRERFGTVRQGGGISGFCNRDESPFDLFTMGHAGTAISTALGVGVGADLVHRREGREGAPPRAIALVGDAAMGAGVAFEGLNYAGHTGLDFLVILNDNEWSISKSVGSLASYLSRIRSSPLLQGMTKELHNLIASIPVIGRKVDETASQIGEVLRHLAVPGHIFEELGITYVGPIDGHDVNKLVDTFERLRKLKGGVLLHTLTQKGKGYEPASTDSERAHGVKPTKKPVGAKETQKIEVQPIANGQPRKQIAFTASFARHLEEIAANRSDVVAITAGMPSGTGLVSFAERFPERFFDVGITEQHGVAFAAGLAESGMRPVAAIYSTFLQRAYDQVFQEVALQRLPVVFAMDRGGLVGQDGPTHNGVYDLAYLRAYPGIALCSPRDDAEMRLMLEWALAADGPVGMRYPRASCDEALPGEILERAPIVSGEFEPALIRGERVALVAYGPLTREALKAAELVHAAHGFRPTVVNARFAKPVDADGLVELARSHEHIVTIEDHTVLAGFGSACIEALMERGVLARVTRVGVPDRFIEHMNSPAEQHAALGMDAHGIAERVGELLS